jgi:protein-S-isoprenylcysteine O-methyltransferase Ste14
MKETKEEATAERGTMKILGRYFRDIRGKGRFSDLLVLVAGGIIWFSAFVISVLDFIMVQGMVYRFDLVSLTGLILGVVGFAVRIQARRTLGMYWSPVVRTLPEHKLIRYGIYKHVRHPGYLGEILAYFLFPLFFHSLYGFLITILVIPVILYRIRIEEHMLIEKYGEEYRDYVQNSKKFIPYVY